MESGKIDIKEMHWFINMLQMLDVGLVVLDREYRIQVWNTFMENHSGLRPPQVIGKGLFETFPDIPGAWFRRKAESVFQLNSRAFVTWEQRPFLFRFRNYQPITGSAEYMYQNVTLVPLSSLEGTISHLGIIVYDVTDMAVNKLELQEANRHLEQLNRVDPLTQLYNRVYLEECLKREFQRSRRTFQSCSLLMFDIDHFKKINDTFGHQAGDAVLQSAAEVLRQSIRDTDIPARYGGEEFCTILIDTNAKEAQLVAERLRQNMEAQVLDLEGKAIRWTISSGIAELTELVETPAQWLECADRALYQAKHAGRNQWRLYKEAV
ncbi:MAG TPA: sensor domain-containing diguanylate cyclase [Gammaproteobacteria bacterium]|nr:sensor domain-containing diguanylate cyclase [Gammaproteobacteria bacterium]